MQIPQKVGLASLNNLNFLKKENGHVTKGLLSKEKHIKNFYNLCVIQFSSCGFHSKI